MYEKLVKPSSPTPDHLRVYKLSLLDHLNGFVYIPMVFLYPLTGVSVNPVESTTERIEQLEKSLSEILSIYYPFAGRFSSTDVHTVDCHDQGVLFLVKKVRTQMNDLIEKRGNDFFNILDTLVPSFYVEEGEVLVEAPLVKVHISVFECGGLAICVSPIKCLTDGFSHTKFIADWAKLMITGGSIGIHVLFNGGEVFPEPKEIDSSTSPPPPPPKEGQVKTMKVVARRILFDGFTLKSLKDHVMSSGGGWSFERPPSKVEVVTAVVCSGLIRAAQDKNGRQRPFMTSLSVNLRGKHVSSDLSENTIGNIYVPVPIKFIPGESKMELYDLVSLIRKTLQEKVSECSKASKEDICAIYIKASNEMKEWSEKEDEFDVVFGTSLCKFPLYDVDFGWGKPSRVSMVRTNFPMFVLMDTESGDGVELFLDLDEPDMENAVAYINNGMHVSNGKNIH